MMIVRKAVLFMLQLKGLRGGRGRSVGANKKKRKWKCCQSMYIVNQIREKQAKVPPGKVLIPETPEFPQTRTFRTAHQHSRVAMMKPLFFFSLRHAKASPEHGRKCLRLQESSELSPEEEKSQCHIRARKDILMERKVEANERKASKNHITRILLSLK